MLRKAKRIDSLQILRAVAFFEIFLGHCGVSFFTGAFGVSIFIVLSGFCVALKYLPQIENVNGSLFYNLKSAIAKIKKLYGLHLIMLFFAFLLAKCPTSADAVKRLVMDVFLVQSLSPHSADFFSYNGVAWYLSVYLFISTFSVYIVKMVSKAKSAKGKILFAGIIYAAMVVIGYYVTKNQIPVGDNFAFWFTYISPFYRVLEFIIGAILGGLYLELGKETDAGKTIGILSEVIGIMAFVGVILIFHKMECIYDGLCYTALFTPVSVFLVVVFAKNQGWILKSLNNKFLLWVGNISSYTFLIHQVVIRWLQRILPETLTGNAKIVVVIILSFLISAAGAELVRMLEKNKN